MTRERDETPEEIRATLEAAAATLEADGTDEGRLAAHRLRTRRCGGCTACCVTKSVEDHPLGPKPACERCPSLAARGCSIYRERPQSCRVYLCAWRVGFGGSEARPDRSGVLVDLNALVAGVGEDGRPEHRAGLTIHGSGKPFALNPIIDLVVDAYAAGVRFVGLADPEDDRRETVLRFDGDPVRLGYALREMARTGLAPEGHSRVALPADADEDDGEGL